MNFISVPRAGLGALVLGMSLLALPLAAQFAGVPVSSVSGQRDNTSAAASLPETDAHDPARPDQAQLGAHERRLKAAAELKAQEHQRILGIMPNFNTSNVQNAERLSAGQKFDLAVKSALDPFTFVAAGLDAGLSQADDDTPGYRQGAEGYGKRLGAAYADTFTGTMLGNAVFPILLHQDPRYFRRGIGSFSSRLVHALASTVICKDDDGKLAPNYSNILGNVAAGGISNLYYPSTDRGAGLTFERAFTVSAEGAIGAVFVEFWPDISKRLFPERHGKDLP